MRASGNNYQRALNTYQAALPQLKLDSRPPWDDRNITNASSHGPGVSVLLATSEQPSFQAGGDASRRHQQQQRKKKRVGRKPSQGSVENLASHSSSVYKLPSSA